MSFKISWREIKTTLLCGILFTTIWIHIRSALRSAGREGRGVCGAERQTAHTWGRLASELCYDGADQVSERKRSCWSKKESKNAVVRHKYGEYKNVLLSDVQLKKLKEKFPYDREKRIEAVDSWVQQKGKGYDDYYATGRAATRKRPRKPRKKSAPLTITRTQVSRTTRIFRSRY